MTTTSSARGTSARSADGGGGAWVVTKMASWVTLSPWNGVCAVNSS
jgi:hypothetical protein